MNRYTAHGIVADAIAGKRVVVAGSLREMPLQMFLDAIPDYPNQVARVYRANGAQRVEFVGGGSVSLVAPWDLRSHSAADVVFLDGAARRGTPAFGGDAAAVVSSTGGEVIRA